jgi:hypothetical protein
VVQRWAACKFRVYAVIGGAVYDVVQIVSTFELNAIPTCTVTVAVGRHVQTLQPATAHRHFESIQIRDTFDVYMQVAALGSEGGAPNNWPNEPFLFFTGMVVGTGWQRSTNGAEFQVHAQHWLANLHYASALSGSSHPGNPQAFTCAAGFSPTVSSAGGGTDMSWVPRTSIEGTITVGALTEDLWTHVLLPYMQELAAADPADPRLIGTGGEEGLLANAYVLDALSRIKSEAMGMDLTGTENLDEYVVGNAIAMALNHTISVNDAHQTLWGKLIGEWSPQYWFALSPRISDAYIVPFTGALRGEPWAEIRAGDYAHCQMPFNMGHFLRCVGIAFPTTFVNGAAASPGENQSALAGLGGQYPAPPYGRGLVLIKDAPGWLAGASQDYLQGMTSCGAVPEAVPMRSSYTPLAVGQEAMPPGEPAQNQLAFQSLMDRYAQQWYTLEMLKGRTAEISGRLRFDIAPGSQVRIEGGRERFIPQDQLGGIFYASVTRVTCALNAEQQVAGTSFTLAHVRNPQENESNDTSVEKPPLYKAAWVGKALIDTFPPQEVRSTDELSGLTEEGSLI